MDNTQNDRLDILTRSVDALLQWAEAHPLTQWEQAGTLSSLRIELEEAMASAAKHDVTVGTSASGR